MIPTNSKVLVRVDIKQKESMLIGGVLFSTAIKFEKNYREKSPVIAKVVEGNQAINNGDIIVCHHNHFYHPSPYHIQDDLYSIPFNHTIFAKVNNSGTLSAVCGNVLGERIPVKYDLDVPPEYQKTHPDRILIKDGGDTVYKPGIIAFTRPNAPYDIVYNWNGEEIRVTKVDSKQICGILA